MGRGGGPLCVCVCSVAIVAQDFVFGSAQCILGADMKPASSNKLPVAVAAAGGDVVYDMAARRLLADPGDRALLGLRRMNSAASLRRMNAFLVEPANDSNGVLAMLDEMKSDFTHTQKDTQKDTQTKKQKDTQTKRTIEDHRGDHRGDAEGDVGPSMKSETRCWTIEETQKDTQTQTQKDTQTKMGYLQQGQAVEAPSTKRLRKWKRGVLDVESVLNPATPAQRLGAFLRRVAREW